MALGSPRAQVLRLIVREGMAVGAMGIGAGLAGALALSRVLASLVFDVPVRDPLTYLAVAGALALVALAACVIPAPPGVARRSDGSRCGAIEVRQGGDGSRRPAKAFALHRYVGDGLRAVPYESATRC